jgi:aminoglycoside 3-N-acetyltransferase
MHKYRDLVLALRDLDLDGSRPAIVHASLSAFGHVQGGAEAVIGALIHYFGSIIMPTFTYKCMIVPEVGPPNNAIDYGNMGDANKMAQFFHYDMPADSLMGVVPETLRQQPFSRRSQHPILSFAGVNADQILKTQAPHKPLAPIEALADLDAWVLLLGVGHTANTSIHLGERLAGRRTFVRWALVPDMVVECPGFPSCSDGFDAIQPHIDPYVQRIKAGQAWLQAVSLTSLVRVVRKLVEEDPFALLCNDAFCPRCKVVREEATASLY